MKYIFLIFSIFFSIHLRADDTQASLGLDCSEFPNGEISPQCTDQIFCPTGVSTGDRKILTGDAVDRLLQDDPDAQQAK